MKKLLYLLSLILFATASQAQIIRTSGGGSTVDTTPLHNQIVQNSTAIGTKIGSQVGTSADPGYTIGINGDSYSNPGAFASFTSKDWLHLLANWLRASIVNIAVNGQRMQLNPANGAGDNSIINHLSSVPKANTANYLAWITLIGLNDVLHQDIADSASFRSSLNKYIDTLTTAIGSGGRGFTAGVCYFGSIPYQTATQKPATVGYSNAIHMGYNAIIQQVCAQRGCVFVDVYTYQFNHGGEAQLWTDSIHINDLGHRNIAVAMYNALAPKTYSAGQTFAVHPQAEFSDIIVHTNRIAPVTTNVTPLAVDSNGRLVLYPDVATVASLTNARPNPGHLWQTGKVVAGGYTTPTDIGNILTDGGIGAEYMRIATYRGKNGNSFPYNAAPYLGPGLGVYMPDSSTVWFEAKNFRNTGHSVNITFSAPHVLFGTATTPTDGSVYYFAGQTKVNSLYLANGTGYGATMQYSSSTVMIDAYNGTAAQPLNINWHGGSTCFNCGFGGSAAASAINEIRSTTQGFLPPRMTSAQRTAIASPAEGLQVWDTDLHEPFWWNGTAWKTVTLQ